MGSAASYLSPVSEYQLLMKVFPTIQFSSDKVRRLVEDQLSQGTSLSTVYRFAHDIFHHEGFYKMFQDVLGDPLALFQYTQSKYSSKKTYQECLNLKISKLMEENPVFKDYFDKYCTTWNSQPLQNFLDKHPQNFEFGFDCQQGLDLKTSWKFLPIRRCR